MCSNASESPKQFNDHLLHKVGTFLFARVHHTSDSGRKAPKEARWFLAQLDLESGLEIKAQP